MMMGNGVLLTSLLSDGEREGSRGVGGSGQYVRRKCSSDVERGRCHPSGFFWLVNSHISAGSFLLFHLSRRLRLPPSLASVLSAEDRGRKVWKKRERTAIVVLDWWGSEGKILQK
ncbi:hypothetical protein Taro_034456 [Colocasia esculenta]|uniref:Uncharacterized protein n=1 Tax=Colocasia esculenta TaxID=4460 RepID=A0A843WA47_COLES|nr:hypothetical protein [Colocasia esculenta]